jgi:hypothetical protein
MNIAIVLLAQAGASAFPLNQAPADRAPLPALRTGSREIIADFDRDGRQDVAALFYLPTYRVVQLHVALQGRHPMLLSSVQADERARRTTLSLKPVGVQNPTCPLVPGPRACGRPEAVRHSPSLLVTEPGRGRHIWTWNGVNFVREEVFD